MKKQVKASAAGLKFYKKDGWTADELNDCITQGEISETPDFFFLNNQSKFDIPKLAPKIGKVITGFKKLARKDAAQILEFLY